MRTSSFPQASSCVWAEVKETNLELFKNTGVMSIWPYVFMWATVRWALLCDLLWLSLCVAEPEGVFPPEVVTLNSTAVRVLWAAPLVPNGAVTQYSVYLDGRLYKSTSNGSGSLEVGGLLPFTVHSIQVWPSVSKHTVTSFIYVLYIIEWGLRPHWKSRIWRFYNLQMSEKKKN